MSDIHAMFRALLQAQSEERGRYHVTLGDLRDAVVSNPGGKVFVDGEGGMGHEGSYRGYYDELAFVPLAEPVAASEIEAACNRALSLPYEGYKGGTYRYSERTPLWLAEYGSGGRALVGLDVRDGNIHLTSRDVD